MHRINAIFLGGCMLAELLVGCSTSRASVPTPTVTLANQPDTFLITRVYNPIRAPGGQSTDMCPQRQWVVRDPSQVQRLYQAVTTDPLPPPDSGSGAILDIYYYTYYSFFKAGKAILHAFEHGIAYSIYLVFLGPHNEGYHDPILFTPAIEAITGPSNPYTDTRPPQFVPRPCPPTCPPPENMPCPPTQVPAATDAERSGATHLHLSLRTTSDVGSSRG
jgi:hypothetical protein